MTPLKAFRDAATLEEQEELAQRAGTTREYLFSHLGIHRSVPMDKAEAVEAVTREMFTRTRGRTPVIYRTSLCETCNRCPFAREVLGDAVGTVAKINGS